jgi:nicotinamide riboside transporter PnuC
LGYTAGKILNRPCIMLLGWFWWERVDRRNENGTSCCKYLKTFKDWDVMIMAFSISTNLCINDLE